jgi:hypothetical protein
LECRRFEILNPKFSESHGIIGQIASFSSGERKRERERERERKREREKEREGSPSIEREVKREDDKV